MKKLNFLAILALALMIALSTSCDLISSQNSPTSTPPAFRVTFLDVGQADSILIQVNNSSLLIDAGTNSAADSVVDALKKLGVNRLDVVGTHPHEDHIGGMDSVINKFDIGKVYLPQVATTTKTFEDVMLAIKNKGLTITNPVPGSSFNLGSATCTILAPNSAKYEDLNNYSIVIRLVYANVSFLFTGDAQVDSEKEMLAKGYTLKSDVLKVGHHGSSSSTSPDFLKAASPRYAVIEVGKDNDYGHPHQVTLDKLNAARIKIYRTDFNGNITFTSDGSNLMVSTER